MSENSATASVQTLSDDARLRALTLRDIVDGDTFDHLACSIAPVTVYDLVTLFGNEYNDAISVQIVKHTPIPEIRGLDEVIGPCDWMYHVCFRKLPEGSYPTWVLPIVRDA